MLVNNTRQQVFANVPRFICVVVLCVNHAKITQEFSFIEILELSDFNSFMRIGAKMSNFSCQINSRVVTYTNILVSYLGNSLGEKTE